MKKKLITSVVSVALLILIGVVIYYSSIQAMPPTYKVIEGNRFCDVMQILSCEEGTDGVMRTKLEDCGNTQIVVTGSCDLYYNYDWFLNHNLVDNSLTTYEGVYGSKTVGTDFFMQSIRHVNSYNLVSGGIIREDIGGSEYHYCDESEGKMWTAERLETLVSGTYFWIEGNNPVYTASDLCCVDDERDGDNLCIGYVWVIDPLPICSSDSDCPDLGYIGNSYCDGKDIVKDFRQGDCISGGDVCSSTTVKKVLETCQDTCSNAVCVTTTPEGEEVVDEVLACLEGAVRDTAETITTCAGQTIIQEGCIGGVWNKIDTPVLDCEVIVNEDKVTQDTPTQAQPQEDIDVDWMLVIYTIIGFLLIVIAMILTFKYMMSKKK